MEKRSSCAEPTRLSSSRRRCVWWSRATRFRGSAQSGDGGADMFNWVKAHRAGKLRGSGRKRV